MTALETAGTAIDTIDVRISYRIIELFSAGLYSSPNKAFEELVCNSYDAFADTVCVFVPPDLTVESAHIWVCDNGEGMDQEGLKELWRIGSSNKRTPKREAQRLQIGRFGIGKLATYVLAHKLTYISKRDDRYLAVTMDYSKIPDDDAGLTLAERELTTSDAESLLNAYTGGPERHVRFSLFGPDAPANWTFVVLTDLKPKAHEIRDGRLKWVLRTALPLNPRFRLTYNGSEVYSTKVSKPLLQQWIIGKDDDVAMDDDTVECRQEDGRFLVDFENLKSVHGHIELYEDSLVSGKSAEMGRSHGIFLMVRDRLVNLDDPTLGLEAFTHGAFNRTRITVHADGLDSNLTSTRESVKESRPLRQLQRYIQRKFNNEVRKTYFQDRDAKQKEDRLAYRLTRTSLTASKRPLLVFAEKLMRGEIESPLLISRPSRDRADELLSELRQELGEEEAFIQKVDWAVMTADDRMALLDLEQRALTINLLHPFVANYVEGSRNPLALEFIATTEVLTEAHLYELGIEERKVNSIVNRRDRTLRELSLSDQEAAPVVAQVLKDAVADPTGLEDAVHRALRSLGFEVTRLGGRGKPDGVASAMLGFREAGKSAAYRVSYDAKSTSRRRIQAKTANLSVVNKHRKKYHAEHALVVAVDFEGSDDERSSIAETCRDEKVTAIRVRDLVRLLLLSAPKQIGLEQLRDLFRTCYSPKAVGDWIDGVQEADVRREPVKEILEAIYDLQRDDTEPPEIASVRVRLNSGLPKERQLSKDEIRKTVESLRTFLPGFISVEGEKVGIQGTPEKILDVISTQIVTSVPVEWQQIYLEAFAEK